MHLTLEKAITWRVFRGLESLCGQGRPVWRLVSGKEAQWLCICDRARPSAERRLLSGV